MSFLDQVGDIIKNNKDTWDYYSCHYNKDMTNIFDNPKCYIQDTFMNAGKKMLILSEDEYNNFNITEARAAHSISSFFLGIILAEGLLGNFNKFVETDDKSYPFSYIWNLTCLYHDYGYQLENDKELSKKLLNKIHGVKKYNNIRDAMRVRPYYYGIYNLRKEKNIRESIWRSYRHAEYCCKSINESESCNECQAVKEIEKYYTHVHKVVNVDSINVTIPVRTSNEISRYFTYRLIHCNCVGCIDHGIAGGMLFFDRIIKNYAKTYLQARMYNMHTDIMEFMYSDLHFSFNQLKIFAYIADCIINHNIWKAQLNNVNIYQDFFLDKLIGDKFEKINYYKNPLLFILIMSDTLEPYKNFNEDSIDKRPYNKFEPSKIFERFNILVGHEVIKVSVDENLKHRCWEKLIDMQDWIDIRCEQNNNEFAIILNKRM